MSKRCICIKKILIIHYTSQECVNWEIVESPQNCYSPQFPLKLRAGTWVTFFLQEKKLFISRVDYFHTAISRFAPSSHRHLKKKSRPPSDPFLDAWRVAVHALHSHFGDGASLQLCTTYPYPPELRREPPRAWGVKYSCECMWVSVYMLVHCCGSPPRYGSHDTALVFFLG